MINPRWLELPLSRTNFHGPKGVRAIEVRLYFEMLFVPHALHYHMLFIMSIKLVPFSLFLLPHSFFLIPLSLFLFPYWGDQYMSFDIGLDTILLLIATIIQSDRMHILA